jgi:hypothetical protein
MTSSVASSPTCSTSSGSTSTAPAARGRCAGRACRRRTRAPRCRLEEAAQADRARSALPFDRLTSGKRCQEFAAPAGVLEQVDALALGEERLERRLGQQRVLAGAVQRQADRFAPQRAEVVLEVGPRARRHGCGCRAAPGLENSAAAIGARATSQACSAFSARSMVGQIGHRVSSRSRLMARIFEGSSMQARIPDAPDLPFQTEPPFAPRPGAHHRRAAVQPRHARPPTPAAVRRYLRQFLGDPRVVEIPRAVWLPMLHGVILPLRSAKSAAKYATIWTPEGSPLKVWTERQAKLLQGWLGERAPRAVRLRDALRQPLDRLAARCAEGRRRHRILVLSAYPQYSGTTTASVIDDVAHLDPQDAQRAGAALRQPLPRRPRLHRRAGPAPHRARTGARTAGPTTSS